MFCRVILRLVFGLLRFEFACMFSLISLMRSFSGDVSTEFGAGGADAQVCPL